MNNVARVGVRVFRKPREDKRPMVGYTTEIYDIDTGALLPVVSADVHFSCDSFVTATLVVQIDDVEIVEAAE